jgi:sulfate adenylyltransferase subunit 2
MASTLESESIEIILEAVAEARNPSCYALSAAMESGADTLEETFAARRSERGGRPIDGDQPGSIEKKKQRQEGYF